MSKIDELIKELCANGVEYKQLDSLVDYLRPDKYTVASTNYNNKYDIPVLTAGQSFILGYTDETDGIYEATKENSVIIFDDFTTAIKWVDFSFKVKSSAMKFIMTKDKNKYNLRYIYYAMQCIYYKPEQHTRQWIATYSKFEIPLPPIEVQNEIVNILDKFVKLEAELEAELEARKVQYEFYRDQMYEKQGNVEYKSIGDFCEVVRGNGLQKTDFTEEGVGCIHYGQIYTYYGISTDTTITFVSEEKASKLKKASQNDLVMATVSENVEDVCKTVAWLGEEDICVSGDSLVLKHKQNPKYLSYYFQSTAFLNYKSKHARGAKVTRVPTDKIQKFEVPLPSLEEQKRIADKLDKFYNLINSITEGLPAEIKMRREQYEYYRDKLLSFEEVEV